MCRRDDDPLAGRRGPRATTTRADVRRALAPSDEILSSCQPGPINRDPPTPSTPPPHRPDDKPFGRLFLAARSLRVLPLPPRPRFGGVFQAPALQPPRAGLSPPCGLAPAPTTTTTRRPVPPALPSFRPFPAPVAAPTSAPATPRAVVPPLNDRGRPSRSPALGHLPRLARSRPRLPRPPSSPAPPRAGPPLPSQPPAPVASNACFPPSGSAARERRPSRTPDRPSPQAERNPSHGRPAAVRLVEGAREGRQLPPRQRDWPGQLRHRPPRLQGRAYLFLALVSLSFPILHLASGRASPAATAGGRGLDWAGEPMSQRGNSRPTRALPPPSPSSPQSCCLAAPAHPLLSRSWLLACTGRPGADAEL